MISKTFIDRPVLSTVIGLVIMLLGGVAILTLPVSLYPPITPPTVQVTALYPGANADVVMKTVALPIEEQVNGVEDMIYMSSTSTNSGAYTLTVTFEIGTDLDFAQVLVENRVAGATAQLPQEVVAQGVVTKKKSTSILEIIALTSPNGTHDSLYLSNYATINLQNELARLPGVGDLTIFGSGEYSIRIWLDPGLMQERGLVPSDVVQAIENQSQQVTAGQIGMSPVPPGQDFQLTMNIEGAYSKAEDFGSIILIAGDQPGSALTRIRDVGRVELGAQSYSEFFNLNGKPAAGIAVYQAPGANSLQVAQAVKDKMDELAKAFPEDLQYSVPFNTTSFINASISEVYSTLFETGLLVLIVIVIFLQNFRAMLVPMTTVPVAIIGGFAAMSAMGFSINQISLFAVVLAIAIVVDDAIVIVESVSKHIEEGKKPYDAAIAAMKELTGPVFGITLVLTSVFLPAAFIPGLTGEIYQQFALVIAATAVISAISALTLTPMQCALTIKPIDLNKKKNFFFTGFNKVFEKVENGYMAFLHKIVSSYKLSAIVALIVAGIAIFGLTRVPGGFVPIEDQGYMLATVQLPNAASLERTEKVMAEVKDRVAKVPGVQDIVAIGGVSALENNAQLANAGMIYITLTPWDERYTSANKKTESLKGMYEALTKAVHDIEEATVSILPPPPIQGLGMSGGFSMELELTNGTFDFTKLQQSQEILTREAVKNPAINSALAPFRADVPQITVQINRSEAEALGVAVGDVFSVIEGYLGSSYAGQFTRFGHTFDVFIQGDGEFRNTPEDLSRLHVRSASGTMVPIGSVATLSDSLGPDVVSLYNLYPAASINGQNAPGYSSGQVIEIMEQLAAEYLPSGVDYSWTAATYQEKAVGNTVYLIFALSILLVYLVLAGQYESWFLPGSIILAVPLSLVGVVIVLLGIPALSNNIYVQIGLVLLIAMSAKNGILIVEVAREFRMQGKSIVDSAMEASKTRFRPILMTSFTLLLGVLPLVLAEGAGASSRKSLGITIFSGMLSSTLLAVLFIPAYYVLIQTWEEKRKAAKAAKAAKAEKQAAALEHNN